MLWCHPIDVRTLREEHGTKLLKLMCEARRMIRSEEQPVHLPLSDGFVPSARLGLQMRGGCDEPGASPSVAQPQLQHALALFLPSRRPKAKCCAMHIGSRSLKTGEETVSTTSSTPVAGSIKRASHQICWPQGGQDTA